MDFFPNHATCIDFGINPNDPNPQYGALQFAVRHEACTKEELDKALGNGEALTEIVNRPSGINGKPNPYACTIKTLWDDIPEDEDE